MLRRQLSKKILHRLQWFWVPFVGSTLLLTLLSIIVELACPGTVLSAWSNVLSGIVTASSVFALAAAVPALAIELATQKFFPQRERLVARTLWVLVHVAVFAGDGIVWLFSLTVPATIYINAGDLSGAQRLLQTWDKLPPFMESIRAALYQNLITTVTADPDGDEYRDRALQSARRAYGEKSSQALSILELKATALMNRSDIEEANKTYMHVLESREALEGADSVGLIPTLRSLSFLNATQKKFQESKQFLLRALAIAKKKSDQKSQVAILTDLALVCDTLQDYDQAKNFWNEKISLLEADRSIQGVKDSIKALIDLGDRYFNLGKMQDAEQQYLKGLKFAREKQSGWLVTAGVCEALGWFYQNNGAFEKSQQHYKEAIETAKAESGKAANIVLCEYASLFDKQKRFDEADKIYAEEEDARKNGNCCLLLPVNVVDYRRVTVEPFEFPATPGVNNAKDVDLSSRDFYFIVDPVHYRSPFASNADDASKSKNTDVTSKIDSAAEPKPESAPPSTVKPTPEFRNTATTAPNEKRDGSAPALVDANRARRLLQQISQQQALAFFRPFSADCLLLPKPRANSGRTVMVLDLNTAFFDFRSPLYEEETEQGVQKLSSATEATKVPGAKVLTGEAARKFFSLIDRKTMLARFPEYRRWFAPPARDRREDLPEIPIKGVTEIVILRDLMPRQNLLIPLKAWKELGALSTAKPEQLKQIEDKLGRPLTNFDNSPIETLPAPKSTPSDTFDKWLQVWSAAVKKNASDPTPLTGRGRLHYEHGSYKDAIADFDQSLQLCKSARMPAQYLQYLKENIFRFRGMSFYKLAEFQKAIDDLTDSINLMPKSSTYRLRANAYECLGRLNAAEADDLTASRLDN